MSLSIWIIILGSLAIGQQPLRIELQPVAPVTRPAGAERGPADRPVISTEVVPVNEQQFKRLLEELNDPRFRVRDQALRRLCQVQAEYLPRLAEHYRTQTSFEVKRRLRYASEYVFFRKQISGERGFLGIRPLPVAGVPDPATGKPIDAIRIEMIIPGQAAEKSGMKPGDLIIAFDGKSVSEIIKDPPPRLDEDVVNAQGRMLQANDPRIDAFTYRVKTSEPGRATPVRILRGGQLPKELVGGVGAEPAKFTEGIDFGGARNGGLLVLQVAPNSQADQLGLQAGDLIMGVNGVSIPQPAEKRLLDEQMARLPANARLVMSIIRASFVEVTIDVTLGSRPMNMINPADDAVLQARFASWWREQGGDFIPSVLANRTSWFSGPGPLGQPAPEVTLLP